MKSIKLSLAFAVFIFTSAAFAQVGAGGGSSAIADTQNRRYTERFNIIDWIRSNQAAVAAQNSKYGRGGGGGSGPYVDLGLSYSQDSGGVVRDSLSLGTDTRGTGRIQFYLDDLFTRGNRSKLLNIDMGVEGFLSQTTSFVAVSTVVQPAHAYKEIGGGLLIRPFGRSSQDTGLAVKGGYINIDEMGLWAANQTPASLYGTYLGAEAKIYLLNFLGIYADYVNVLENPVNALNGKWKMQRFKYGAFLEIYLVNLSAYFVSNEMILTNNISSAQSKENYSGVGFSASVYF